MGVKKKMIKEIIKNFDFDKVINVMVCLGWKWAGSNEIPTIKELKRNSKQKLKNAYELAKDSKVPDVSYFSSSGGFKGTAVCDENGKVTYLALEFIICEYEILKNEL